MAYTDISNVDVAMHFPGLIKYTWMRGRVKPLQFVVIIYNVSGMVKNSIFIDVIYIAFV